MKKVMIGIGICLCCGCATLGPWTELTLGNYRDNTLGFATTVPSGWMRYNYADYFLITRDGLLLNRISVERRDPHKPLEFSKKTFDLNMLPQDLAELEIDNLKSNTNFSQFTLLQNKPTLIDTHEACFLEYTYVTEDGLRVRGKHIDLFHKKWVYRITYEAAQQHYFDASLKDFNCFLESFKLIHK